MKKQNNLLALIMVLSGMLFSCSTNERFKLIPSKTSNVDFANEIFESDSFNIIEYGHIYNGGGVAIADFNNDGLQDLYFIGNMVSNRLYLNQGDFKFDDVTKISNTDGEGKWCYGVAVVDINNDGFKDIYIAVTANPDSLKRENIFYINKGLNDQGIPQFEDMAKEYGLADNSHTTNAVFFDYDNDGDLDLYLLVNKMEFKRNSRMEGGQAQMSAERIDKLYRNDWNDSLQHAMFKDVSKEAGIIYDGYGLGVNVSDINQDGYKDIYVTNDYSTQDLTYINQQDGTFRNMNDEYFKHISYSAMGNDIADVNNDGLLDVFVLDMLPEDNYRKKTMVAANTYSSYLNKRKKGYQYVRNTLQLNQGVNPETGDMVFSDIGMFSGISETDWSWSPLIADFDNDGLRDLLIVNGFPKDVTDRDYIEYQAEVGNYASERMLMSKIPSVKIKNYAYKNMGEGKFENVTEKWGLGMRSFSNGAAYGDLDNDGDLDYVANNINDKPFIYQNLTNDKKDHPNSWIKISLKGSGQNINAIGTILKIYTGSDVKYWDHTLSRGYLSSIDENIIFGLGKKSIIDSILVFWPNGRMQKLTDVKVNQRLVLDIEDADLSGTIHRDTVKRPLFDNYSFGFDSLYVYRERDFNDFSVQPLLPHKLSQYGPGISVGDVNGDGLEDMYLGGANFFKGRFLIQKSDGTFENRDLLPGTDGPDKKQEEMGTLLFDADLDGDLDLYIVSGSYEFTFEDGDYQDKLFQNNGGAFEWVKEALPQMNMSGSCVRAADFDKDGDLDLFVGGRVYPHEYPKPVDSYVLVNESTKENIEFKKADDSINSLFENFGMVTDAIWTDFNNDTWVDLIVVGEWMPIRFFKNQKGKFIDISETTGISQKIGWWNSITSIDYDQDGDMDYVAGNLGLNSLFRASDEYPLKIYGLDFDHNKTFDAIPFSYFKDADGDYREYPFFGKMDYKKQIPGIGKQFAKHAEFAFAEADDIFTRGQLDSAYILKANYMYSSVIENEGGEKFTIKPLPSPCQWAPVYGMLTQDINHDGNDDIMMIGNEFGNELLAGRYDAFNGLVLLGNGKGDFDPLSIQKSGFFVPGDAKALVQLPTDEGTLFIASENRGSLRAFKNPLLDSTMQKIRLEPEDFIVSIDLGGGKKIRKECYYGSSFLSQSSRSLSIPKYYKKVEITTYSGKKRVID